MNKNKFYDYLMSKLPLPITIMWERELWKELFFKKKLNCVTRTGTNFR